uniref:Rap-GAP domain-containing protein n=1 Tax=Strigamia maritima TaxID=126957 RepID=T1JIJ7_STRMM
MHCWKNLIFFPVLYLLKSSKNKSFSQDTFMSGFYMNATVLYSCCLFVFFYRIMVRTVSYCLHGLIPASCLAADRYNREDVVRSLSNEISLHPLLQLGQLPSTSDELLKLDQKALILCVPVFMQIFIKSELKVGVLYVKENQSTEEDVLDNNETTPIFKDFLLLLGDQICLKGFDKYKGGLDTTHDLTGTTSVYSYWRGIEIMFHVSTMLPYDKNDPQKLQRKRHIGNDIVCVVFLEAESTNFSPTCIKSHFLHTFIVVQAKSANTQDFPVSYKVSVVTRDEVGAYKPYLYQKSVFIKGPLFREWLLTKIVNGERASYSAPKFARMQDRTRSQLLEDIVTNLQNHAETGQMPKPYRRGSWRPIGHMRPSSPLLDSMRDLFEGYDQLAKDFTRSFKDTNAFCDIVFNVGQGKDKVKVYAIRAILAVRSRVFQEMLYGITSGMIGTSQSPLEALNRAVTPTYLSKSSNFLQVPEAYEPSRHKTAPSSPMVMRAFSRLTRWDWSGKKQDNHHLTTDYEPSRSEKRESKQDAAVLAPRLSICADIQKVDKNKILQSEFSIIEFDADTFETLLEYLHTGSCPLTCRTIPGLICSAEHFDLPELLQACFHHAKQHLRIDVVCSMLASLENYYWRYTSASELVNMILTYIDSRALLIFEQKDFFELSESMVQMILCRELSITEVEKFNTMLNWAKNKVEVSNVRDSNFEFRCTMERLTRDLKLYNISPNELIKIVLPTKAIRNERILETLMYQANTGMYKVQHSLFQECRTSMQGRRDSSRRDSRPDMRLFGMMSFDHRESLIPIDGGYELNREDTLLEEYTAASIKRQESLDSATPLLKQNLAYKRRSSKPDFWPLLQRQDPKRTGIKYHEKPMIQFQDTTTAKEEKPSSQRRDSRLLSWLSRQDSRLEEASKSGEIKTDARRDSRASLESKLHSWFHRQESRSDSQGEIEFDAKTNEIQSHSKLKRQETRVHDEEGEQSHTKRRESRLFLWKHHSKTTECETETSKQRRDSKLLDSKFHSWFHRSEDDSKELLRSKDDGNFSSRRSSRDQEERFMGCLGRRDSRVEFKNGGESSGEKRRQSRQISRVDSIELPSTSTGRQSRRRDSKLYVWFFKHNKSQDESKNSGC